jgi:hypothetical protein
MSGLGLVAGVLLFIPIAGCIGCFVRQRQRKQSESARTSAIDIPLRILLPGEGIPTIYNLVSRRFRRPAQHHVSSAPATVRPSHPPPPVEASSSTGLIQAYFSEQDSASIAEPREDV